ncbi:methyl-accepting chemotaxis protein [Magnetococcus sp. PR-3]|uniref:methyl-accepting chemotaxis protein n=1 Tax=Magnetococcus sp. PR-3 TaxID=3120355 RepID=UPI002FCE56AD
MQLKVKIVTPVLAILLVVSVTLFLVAEQALLETSDHFVDQIIDNKMADLEKNIARMSRKALTAASMASKVPGVEQAYRQAASGDFAGGKDQLIHLMKPIQKQVEQMTGVKQFRLHFHRPPAHSFVRVWNGKGADDLSGFRQTVVHINQDRKPLWGIEVGRGGFVMRGLAPVIASNGEHLGSVESLVPLKSLVKLSKNLPEEQFGVVMVPELLTVATKLQKNTVRMGDFIFTGGTHRFQPKLVDAGLVKAALQAQQSHDQGEFRVVYHPIQDFSGRPVGVVIYQLDLTAVHALSRAMFYKQGAIMIGLMVLAGLLFWVVVDRLIKRLNRINGALDKITQGDVRQRLPIAERYQDELDLTAQGINALSASLASTVSASELQGESLQAVVVQLDQASVTLADDSSQAQTLAEDMLVSNHALAEEGRSVNASVGRILSRIEQASHASEEQLHTVHSISSATEQASTNISTMAAAAEEMSANVVGVNQSLLLVNDAIESMATTTRNIRSGLSDVEMQSQRASDASRGASDQAQATLKVMEQLDHNSREIDKVVDMITMIAQQTNMLALNASIEAAGAGEAGKGFAVVANEVKSLAAETSRATKLIAEKVAVIQEQSKTAAHSAEDISKRVMLISEANEEILSSVVDQTGAIEGVSLAMDEANDGSKEVARNMSELELAAQEVARAAGEAAQGTLTIGQAVEQGVAVTQQGAEQLNHIQNSAQAIFASVEKNQSFIESVQNKAVGVGTGLEQMHACIVHLRHLVAIVKNTSNALTQAQQDMQLDGAHFDVQALKGGHLQWLTQLQGVVSGRHEVGAFDPKGCAVGSWLSSTHAQPLQGHAPFPLLKQSHEQMVQLASEIVQKPAEKQQWHEQLQQLHHTRHEMFEHMDALYLRK